MTDDDDIDIDNDDDSDADEDCLWFREKCDSLRLAASSVAAMAGYNPYRDLAELAVHLVYQGTDGRRLLRHDAALLGGISLMSKEEQLMQMLTAKNASQGTKQALEQALAVGRGTMHVSSVEHANKIKQAVLTTAKLDKNLTAQDLLLLQEGTRSAVDTGYGTFHEDVALDQFQIMTGCEIRNRNSSLLQWSFIRAPPSSDSHGKIIGNNIDTVIPMGPPTAIASSSSWRKQNSNDSNNKRKVETKMSRQEKKTKGEDDDDDENDVDGVIDLTTIEVAEENEPSKTTTTTTTEDNIPACNSNNNEQKENKQEASSEQPKPFFVIMGSVDGIRDEIVPKISSSASHQSDGNNRIDSLDDDDDDDWTIKEIIVEVKHRMRQIYKVPPLYEQIQATVYCFMYNVTDADLVQVLRRRRNDDGADNTKGGIKQVKRPAGAGATAVSTAESMDDCLQERLIEESNSLTSCNNKEEKEMTGTQSLLCEDATIRTHCLSSPVELPCDSSADVPLVKPHDSTVEEDTLAATPHEVNSVESDEKEKVVEESNACSTQLDSSSRDKAVVKNCTIVADSKPRPLPVAATTTISASRISLDDPLWRHGKQWEEVILPRLCSFVQAVYEIRRNDDKRYRLLLAVSSSPPPKEEHDGGSSSSKLQSSTRDGWKILFDECPWLLRDCSDTAYHRNYK